MTEDLAKSVVAASAVLVDVALSLGGLESCTRALEKSRNERTTKKMEATDIPVQLESSHLEKKYTLIKKDWARLLRLLPTSTYNLMLHLSYRQVCLSLSVIFGRILSPPLS